MEGGEFLTKAEIQTTAFPYLGERILYEFGHLNWQNYTYIFLLFQLGRWENAETRRV